MNAEEQAELLSRVDIFESLQKGEIRELLSDLLQRNAEINLQAGEVFYTPQQPDGKLFILTKGRVRIYKMEGTREFTLEVVDAGTVFGEVAFTPHALRDAYAEAMEPSVLLAMDRADVERLIQHKPQVGIRIISILSERLHYYETRMQDVTLKEVPARLASLILFLVEREGQETRGDQHTNPLQPRAPRDHDRGQQRGCDQGIRAPSGRGGAPDQAAHHLRR
jgi:CRP/FNR family cyclic AMP-dependent transcriptional regulator